MTVKQQLHKEIDILDEPQLQAVQYFIESLKSGLSHFSKSAIDENKLAVLYHEFEDEDRILAEGGMDSYSANLEKEDKK